MEEPEPTPPPQPNLVADLIFAPIDADLHLERVAGGNESEVYATDDYRYVVKVKSEDGHTLEEALAEAKMMRDTAMAHAEAIGAEHSIPNDFFLSKNSKGEVQTVIIQPYLLDAKALFDVDYKSLKKSERKQIGKQLRTIIQRSLKAYQKEQMMPDIYGRTSKSKEERKRLNAPHMLPWRMWSFLVKRNLLRSHNLMVTEAPELQIVLVDYDPVKKSKLYKFVYYNVRRTLFLRDWLLILLMEQTGYVWRA